VGSVRPIRAIVAGVSLAVVVAGCSLGSSPGDTGLSADSGSGQPTAPDDSFGPIESIAPEGSGTGALPGFDGWQTINPGSVDISATESGLAMTLVKRALWFQTSKGVLFYTVIDGDFRVSATVETSKTSDSSVDPGGDGTVQLAGLMARADVPQENYVFITVGADASGLSVETKSTTNGSSKFAGPDWPSGDAELELCRIGTTFTLWKRAVGSTDDFTLAQTYQRPDLAGSLQVGTNIYSDSPPDITAVFGDLTIEPLAPGEAC
jgi:hypothetical protein